MRGELSHGPLTRRPAPAARPLAGRLLRPRRHGPRPGRDRRPDRAACRRRWTGTQVDTKLARGYDGAVAGDVNAWWFWLPLCVLFLAPFVDPRRPLRLLHLDLLALLGFSVSLFFFNQAEIGLSVRARLSGAGLPLRARADRRVPPEREPGAPAARSAGAGRCWSAIVAPGAAPRRLRDATGTRQGDRRRLAGVIGADRLDRRRGRLQRGLLRRPAVDRRRPRRRLRAGQLPRLRPLRAGLSVERRLGRGLRRARRGARLRPADGARAVRARAPAPARAGRARPRRAGRSGSALAFAWLAYPFTMYTLGSSFNDSLVALPARLLRCSSSPRRPARGAMSALAAADQVRPAGAGAAVRGRDRRAAPAAAGRSSRSRSRRWRRWSRSRCSPTAASGSSTTARSATRPRAARRSASGARRRRWSRCRRSPRSSRSGWRSPSSSSRGAASPSRWRRSAPR